MGKYKLNSRRGLKAIDAKWANGSTFIKESNLSSGSSWTCKDSEWNPYNIAGVCIGLSEFGAQPFNNDTSSYFGGTLRMAGLLPTYTYTPGTDVNVLIVANYSGKEAQGYPCADLQGITAKSSCIEIG